LAALSSVMQIEIDIEYEWEPFNINGDSYYFEIHFNKRKIKNNCSHFGPAIYKWEGEIKNKRIILIGETNDLLKRINQYRNGTQDSKHSGNKYWREKYLKLGNLALFILKINSININNNSLDVKEVLKDNSVRLIIEQSLIFYERSRIKGNNAVILVNVK
jgi:hypothetical protein